VGEVGEGERALVREPPPDQAGGLAQSLSELGIYGVNFAKLPSPIGRQMRGCMIEAGAKFVSAAYPSPAAPIGVASLSSGELPPETVIVFPE
jgi:hypothetical protein